MVEWKKWCPLAKRMCINGKIDIDRDSKNMYNGQTEAECALFQSGCLLFSALYGYFFSRFEQEEEE